MNWLVNVVRPKINNLWPRKDATPENLWIKCPETGQLVFHKDVEANDWVIPGSGYQMRMGAKQRLATLPADGAAPAAPASGATPAAGGKSAPAKPDSPAARRAAARQSLQPTQTQPTDSTTSPTPEQ